MTNRPIPFHMALFALYPVEFLYLHNIAWYKNLSVYLAPLAIVLAGVAAIFLLLWALWRERYKAALLTSLFTALFFSFDLLYFKQIQGGFFTITFKEDDFVRLLATIFLLGTFLVWRKRKADFSNATRILNAVSAALVLLPVATFLLSGGPAPKEAASSQTPEIPGIHVGELSKGTPDIYYIILDGYAHETTLRELFGLDNSAFYQALAERGFQVIPEARANYTRTRLSLPSTLNMEFLREDFVLDGVIEPMRAARYLQSRGYRFVNFSSGWGGTTNLPFADLNVTYNDLLPDSEVLTLLLKMTALRPWVIGKGFTRDQVLFTFDSIPKVVASADASDPNRPPFFLMAHIIAPHPPFVFKRDGSAPSEAEMSFDGDVWQFKDRYVDQLLYTNTRVIRMLDELLALPGKSPVIILQADHGSKSNQPVEERATFTDQSIQERVRIFHAYRLPNVDMGSVVPPDITPVNTFRLLFNLYFDEDFEMLPDKSYLPFGNDGHFRFEDVTERADFH